MDILTIVVLAVFSICNGTCLYFIRNEFKKYRVALKKSLTKLNETAVKVNETASKMVDAVVEVHNKVTQLYTVDPYEEFSAKVEAGIDGNSRSGKE